MQASIHELQGKRLACGCEDHKGCHVDILVEAANNYTGQMW